MNVNQGPDPEDTPSGNEGSHKKGIFSKYIKVVRDFFVLMVVLTVLLFAGAYALVEGVVFIIQEATEGMQNNPNAEKAKPREEAKPSDPDTTSTTTHQSEKIEDEGFYVYLQNIFVLLDREEVTPQPTVKGVKYPKDRTCVFEDLKPGSKGAKVSVFQRRMNESFKGHADHLLLRVDGDFGPRTLLVFLETQKLLGRETPQKVLTKDLVELVNGESGCVDRLGEYKKKPKNVSSREEKPTARDSYPPSPTVLYRRERYNRYAPLVKTYDCLHAHIVIADSRTDYVNFSAFPCTSRTIIRRW